MPKQLCLEFCCGECQSLSLVYPTHSTRVQIEAFDGDPAVLCLDVENVQEPSIYDATSHFTGVDCTEGTVSAIYGKARNTTVNEQT